MLWCLCHRQYFSGRWTGGGVRNQQHGIGPNDCRISFLQVYRGHFLPIQILGIGFFLLNIGLWGLLLESLQSSLSSPPPPPSPSLNRGWVEFWPLYCPQVIFFFFLHRKVFTPGAWAQLWLWELNTSPDMPLALQCTAFFLCFVVDWTKMRGKANKKKFLKYTLG